VVIVITIERLLSWSPHLYSSASITATSRLHTSATFSVVYRN